MQENERGLSCSNLLDPDGCTFGIDNAIGHWVHFIFIAKASPFMQQNQDVNKGSRQSA